VVVVDRPTFSGDTIFEVEPNEDIKTTQVLPIPGQIGGVLNAPTDVDVFRLDIKTEGLLKLTLECPDDVDLTLELLGADGKTQVKSDRGPAKTTEGVANLPVVAGSGYFMRVREFRKKGAPPRTQSATYRLTAELSGPAPEDQEKEPNEEATLGTPLALGARGFGYLGWARDRDVWNLQHLQLVSGVLNVTVEGVEGLPLKVTVVGGEEFALSRTGAAGQTVLIPNIQFVPEIPYRVEIESKRSDPAVPYILRVDAQPPNPTGELEPNDDPVRAVPLQAAAGVPSGTRSGTYGFGDRDVYRLDVTEDARLDVEVRPGPKSNPSLEVRLGEDLIPADGAKFGAPEQVSAPVAAGSTIYIIVSGVVRGDDTGYQLSYALSAPTPEPAPAPEPAPL
jgi:hypothetical protein